MNPKCNYCGEPYAAGHVCDKLKETTAQTIADLRGKVANLVALGQGVHQDLQVTPHTEKARNLLYTMQAHLAQAQDAAEVMQTLYPLKGIR